MSKVVNKNYEEILKDVPTPVLLKAARERNRVLRSQHGKYAAQKKLQACPGCQQEFGVRELWQHKRECPQYQALKQSDTAA